MELLRIVKRFALAAISHSESCLTVNVTDKLQPNYQSPSQREGLKRDLNSI